MKKFIFGCLLVIAVGLSGCAYDFTNGEPFVQSAVPLNSTILASTGSPEDPWYQKMIEYLRKIGWIDEFEVFC